MRHCLHKSVFLIPELLKVAKVNAAVKTTMHKKLKKQISLANVNKSTANCEFV